MRPALALLALLVSLSNCTGSGPEGPQPITLRFAPVVGGEAFACGPTYAGLGTTAASFSAVDFRLYVHDVAVIHAGGEREVIELADNQWQGEGVALLDFEDASGSCTGSAERNLEITGTVSDASDVTAIEFRVGVPTDLNHLDSAAAAAPLNIAGMYWSWMGGYKYLRVDLAGAGGESFVFHLGATQCTGDTASGYTCAHEHVGAPLRIDGFDPEVDAIAVDLAALLAGSDLTTANDAADPIEGCMSGPTDPECPPLFHALGLDFTGDGGAGEQAVFRRTTP